MLLNLILSAVDPSSPVDLPPATDPTGRVIALALAFLAVAGPYATAKVSAKKGVTNGPPLAGNGAVAPLPRLDVGQQYLERYIKGLEDDVEALKAENAIQRQQVLQLTGDRATFLAQNEALREDIAGLRAEIQELRGQLRGRGSGR